MTVVLRCHIIIIIITIIIIIIITITIIIINIMTWLPTSSSNHPHNHRMKLTVILNIFRHIIVNHMLNIREVQSFGCHISSHEHILFTIPVSPNTMFPFLLTCHVTMCQFAPERWFWLQVISCHTVIVPIKAPNNRIILPYPPFSAPCKKIIFSGAQSLEESF